MRQVGGQSNVHDCPRKVGRQSVKCPRGPNFDDFCHSKVWNLQAFKQFQFLSFNKQPKGFFSLVFKILHINFVNSLFFLTLICSFMYLITILLFLIEIKVIIEKSRGDVSLMEQDTMENVSQPIKKLKCFFKISYIFDTVRPRDTRLPPARTLQVHVFELGPKRFELNEFMQ